MGSLMDEVKAAQQGQSGCPIGRLIGGISDEEERVDLASVLSLPTTELSSQFLTGILRKRYPDLRMGNNAVNNHRRGRCACQ